MNLINQTILDVYTYKNRKILCQIKVNSDCGKFKNCRCLTAEQWLVFDENLEKLIPTVDEWNSKTCLKFHINTSIKVKIQKSSLSLRHFNKCIGTSRAIDGKWEEPDFILECLFEFKREILFSPPLDSQEPELHTQSSVDRLNFSPLSYEQFTPSREIHETNKIDTVKTPGIDFLKWDENTYSPESNPAKESNGGRSNEILQNSIDLGESNGNDNLSVIVIDKTENSKTSNAFDDSKHVKPENTTTSLETAGHNRIEPSKKSKTEESQDRATDEVKGPTNSTYENIALQLNDENVEERHISRSKKLKTETNDSHHEERREEFTLKTENMLCINEIENVNKGPHKKSDKSIESVSPTEREKKEKDTFATAKSSAKKYKENFFDDDAATPLNKKETRIHPETPAIVINNSSESAIEMSPEKAIRKERKPKSCSKDTIVSLRRSERSPTKPKRFLEELPGYVRKSKTKQKSDKINELFGSDEDEEDQLFENKKAKINRNYKTDKLAILETPVNKKPVECSSTSSSKKKKRKRDKSVECQQEKRDINKWLCKKSSKPLDREAKTTPNAKPKTSLIKPLPLKSSSNQEVENDAKKRAQSVTPPPMTIDLPSKEELELMRNKTNLMREENAKLKAELDKMRTSPPKEVDILSLANIPEDKMLSTFSTYKTELDDIFRNNRKRDYIKGHDGINHCLIIRLLQNSTQMKMLKKLTDVYGCSDSTTQATLFANALLPEWVIRVFMETFSFTRQQAIDQIKAQEAFQLHIEEQNENSFEFD